MPTLRALSEMLPTPLTVPDVVRNILTRSSEREHRQPPRLIKTALVVQGGTLRSVASCGAAAALNLMGLTNAFDTVYGASSGAVNAAYFLARQAALGVTVYLDDVNSKRFLNLLRFHKMIDLEFFFDQIVRDRKRHDLDALRTHPTELKILTTDLDRGETVWFSSKDPELDIYLALKASCALPLIYGRGVRVGERRCIDGYITEPLPITTPLASDYTDILVLLTRHVSYRQSSRPGLLSRLLVDPLIKREIGPRLSKAYDERWKAYNTAADIVQAGVFRRPDGSTARITFICPDPHAEVHRFEMDRNRLEAAAHSSWSNALRLFQRETNASLDTFRHQLACTESVIGR